MIYRQVAPEASLSQGDIIDECPLLVWAGRPEEDPNAAELLARVIVLTQACDLAQSKRTRAVVALVHSARQLVDQGVLKARTVRDQVRTHRVYGWYFLPAGPIPESMVDLHDLHTLPRSFLQSLIDQGNRLGRISTPYREHLGQHFSNTYSRIGLPEPYETES